MSLTAVPGVEVGHWTHPSGTTGATAVLFPTGARGGVCIPGSAAGSRELAVLDPRHLAGRVDGFVLSGGSAFGLATATGVMDVLAERGCGFDTGHGLVPIVPGAVLFDLHTGVVRPDRESGRLAARDASAAPVAEGRVGAGAGARVGVGSSRVDPGGLGSASFSVGGAAVGALVAVNAVGSVRDPETGTLLAAVALEADLPSATLQQLLYTLGQAQLGEQVLLVQGEAVPRTPARVEGGTEVQVAPTDAGFALGAGPSRREVTTLPPRLGAASTPAATLLLGETTAYGAVVRSLDALAGAGVYCVVPVADPTRSAPPPVTTPPARRTPLLLSEMMTAHLLSLPALGTGEMPARIDGIACPTKQVELNAFEIPCFTAPA